MEAGPPGFAALTSRKGRASGPAPDPLPLPEPFAFSLETEDFL